MSSTEVDQVAEDYATATTACALVDRSDRGKLALTGPDAAEFLNGQVTNDIVGLTAGEGCYAAFLTHKGKMLGDLRVLAVAHLNGDDSDPALLLDTERAALQALFDMIRRFKVGWSVELHKRTLEQGLVSLIGPDARRVAALAAGYAPAAADPAPAAADPAPAAADPAPAAADPAPPSGAASPTDDAPPTLARDEHASLAVRIDGVPALLISTDVGVDVLFAASALATVTAALTSAGAHAIGVPVAEIVRVESGRPRYAVDIDDGTIPQEAGLNARAVSFTKGCYVGQETVARLYYRGQPTRHLRGLVLDGPAASGAELHLLERLVGHLGSSVSSPRLGPIALALVRREAAPGDELSVGDEGVRGRVVELPFPV